VWPASSLVEAALETGCRRGELLSLQWWQVRWEQNELFLPAGKTKAKQDRFIPITQRLRAILDIRKHDPAGREFPADTYAFGNEIGQRITSMKTAWLSTCRRAGIVGLHFHDLRREAASRLLEGHVPEHYVQAFLGHADLTTTSAYLATTRKGLHQQFQRYEAWRTQQCKKTSGDQPTEQQTDASSIMSAGSDPAVAHPLHRS
jgi:integrase